MQALPVFDCNAMFAALDAQRSDRDLSWPQLADELYEQSSELNAQLMDHAVCPGAVVRVHKRGTISCQYALMMLRWLRRAPEEFLAGPVVDVGDTTLPDIGPDSRLRWDLPQTHAELDERRQQRGLAWVELARELDCTPARLTNLRTARIADMGLAVRVTQWLARPAAAFVHAARW